MSTVLEAPLRRSASRAPDRPDLSRDFRPSRPFADDEHTGRSALEARFAEEHTHILRAKTADQVVVRWVLIVGRVPLVALLHAVGLLPITYRSLALVGGGVSVVNALFWLALRRGTWRPWQFWAAWGWTAWRCGGSPPRTGRTGCS